MKLILLFLALSFSLFGQELGESSSRSCEEVTHAEQLKKTVEKIKKKAPREDTLFHVTSPILGNEKVKVEVKEVNGRLNQLIVHRKYGIETHPIKKVNAGGIAVYKMAGYDIVTLEKHDKDFDLENGGFLKMKVLKKIGLLGKSYSTYYVRVKKENGEWKSLKGVNKIKNINFEGSYYDRGVKSVQFKYEAIK